MSLMNEIKVRLRIPSDVDAFDSEVESLISAAMRELKRVGVSEALIAEDTLDPLAKEAIALFCKSRFGYDNDEAQRFETAFRQTVIDLLNAPAQYRETTSEDGSDGSE